MLSHYIFFLSIETRSIALTIRFNKMFRLIWAKQSLSKKEIGLSSHLNGNFGFCNFVHVQNKTKIHSQYLLLHKIRSLAHSRPMRINFILKWDCLQNCFCSIYEFWKWDAAKKTKKSRKKKRLVWALNAFWDSLNYTVHLDAILYLNKENYIFINIYISHIIS